MTNFFKKSLMVSAIAIAVAGCNSGSSSSSGGGGASASGETITGVASAPGGSVAVFEQKNAFEIALNFIVSPVAAAITGLEPVPGASVELIRVDDLGVQIGEVLATTATSITGDYTLTLPAGVNLAGNLIVRITGANGTEMRAQVVEKEVDISPVSDFVLSKFIDQGAALDNLTTASVVKLSGQVEEFDLTAGVDMSTMLAALEEEVGVFVESQIDLIESTPADASLIASIAGDYRSSALDFGLHDDDQQTGTGTFSSDVWQADFNFADGGNGLVNITINGEESAWANLSGSDLADASIYYVAESDDEVEEFSSQITSEGVIAIESTFEEDIDGDSGWRSAPALFRLQKVKDKNLFVLVGGEAEVRYATVDTNGDNEKDAVDPAQREGDEVFKSLEVFLKKPTAMTSADLDGDFGRVYLGAELNSSGFIELEAENNTLTFDGENSSLNVGDAARDMISRDSSGVVEHASDTVDGLLDLTVELSASGDGDIVSIGGEPADGFINDSYDFIAFAESEGTNGDNANFSKTLAIKLPSTTPTLSGKNYRLMFLGVGFSGTELSVSTTEFKSILAMSSNTAGTLTGASAGASKSSLSGEITPEIDDGFSLSATVTVGSDGSTTMTLPDGDETLVLEGFFNGEGSMGIFRTSYGTTGNDPDELGLAVLVDVTE